MLPRQNGAIGLRIRPRLHPRQRRPRVTKEDVFDVILLEIKQRTTASFATSRQKRGDKPRWRVFMHVALFAWYFHVYLFFFSSLPPVFVSGGNLHPVFVVGR